MNWVRLMMGFVLGRVERLKNMWCLALVGTSASDLESVEYY